jgi:hypothetical protein
MNHAEPERTGKLRITADYETSTVNFTFMV